MHSCLAAKAPLPQFLGLTPVKLRTNRYEAAVPAVTHCRGLVFEMCPDDVLEVIYVFSTEKEVLKTQSVNHCLFFSHTGQSLSFCLQKKT